MPVRSRKVSTDFLLFLLVFVTYGYFHNGGMSNQNARFDAIVAFVEPGTPDTGTFRIDRFLRGPNGRLPAPESFPTFNALDWSWSPPNGVVDPDPDKGEKAGHYYANKAPGTILLGVVAYAPLYYGELLLGADPREFTVFNLYVVNLFVSVFFASASVVVFRHLLILSGSTPQWALLLALTLAFSTFLFPYSTQLWGNSTAAAFIIISLFSVLRSLSRESACWMTSGGAFAGLAVLTDYTAILITVALGIYAVSKSPKRIHYYLLGGLAPLAVFMWYHCTCFGSPFTLATANMDDIWRDNNRFLGVLGPIKWRYIGALLFSRWRGILAQMPVLVLSVIGAIYWVRRNPMDRLLGLDGLPSLLPLLGYIAIMLTLLFHSIRLRTTALRS